MTEIVDFLIRFYGIGEATARELIAEGMDTTSLQSLAGVSRGTGGDTAQILKGCYRCAEPSASRV